VQIELKRTISDGQISNRILNHNFNQI